MLLIPVGPFYLVIRIFVCEFASVFSRFYFNHRSNRFHVLRFHVAKNVFFPPTFASLILNMCIFLGAPSLYTFPKQRTKRNFTSFKSYMHDRLRWNGMVAGIVCYMFNVHVLYTKRIICLYQCSHSLRNGFSSTNNKIEQVFSQRDRLHSRLYTVAPMPHE